VSLCSRHRYVFSSSLRVEILKVLRHFFDLCVVMILDFSNKLGIIWQYEIDSNTLSSETTCSTNSMDVVLFLLWQFIIDNKTNLLDINTSCHEISADEYSSSTCSELFHDGVSCNLVHFTVHC